MWEIWSWESIKDGWFLKKSWPADSPNTCSEILPLTSMTIMAKFNTADYFKQLYPLIYHWYHLHHHLQPSPHTTQWLIHQIIQLSLRKPFTVRMNVDSYYNFIISINSVCSSKIICEFFKFILLTFLNVWDRMWVSWDKRANGFQLVVQISCTHLKDIMPSNFLAICNVLSSK